MPENAKADTTKEVDYVDGTLIELEQFLGVIALTVAMRRTKDDDDVADDDDKCAQKNSVCDGNMQDEVAKYDVDYKLN